MKDYSIGVNNKYMIEHHCRVCGLYIEDPPWGEDNRTPSYDICPCCGMEFGFEDYRLDLVRQYRQQWLDGGAGWFEKKEKPPNWDLTEQMKNIPKEWL